MGEKGRAKEQQRHRTGKICTAGSHGRLLQHQKNSRCNDYIANCQVPHMYRLDMACKQHCRWVSKYRLDMACKQHCRWVSKSQLDKQRTPGSQRVAGVDPRRKDCTDWSPRRQSARFRMICSSHPRVDQSDAQEDKCMFPCCWRSDTCPWGSCIPRNL